MTIIKLDKIQIKRGVKANIPVLDIGEPYLCTDTGEIAFGSSSGNIFINLSTTKTAQLGRLGVNSNGKLTIDNIEFAGGSGGSGALVFNTLSDLQTAFPTGTTQPAWVIADNEWYYWTGAIVDTIPPADVTGLAATNVAATSLTLSWTASTSTDIANYDVYQGTTLLGNVTGTSFNVTGLTASTNYTFTVKSKDTSGNVSTGASITQATTAPSSDTTAPNNVASVSTSNLSTTSVTLTWPASTSNDVASYDIYNGSTLVANTANLSYTVTGLTASTSYTFWVKARDGAGNVASGTIANITTAAPADTTPPVLTITPAAGTFTTSQSVTLSATDDSGVTPTIYYTLDGTTPTTSSAVYSSALTLNATTTVKAFAKDTAGNSSTIQSVTYTLQADTTPPTIIASPAAGSYSSVQTVTLSANETATIYYTTDGSTPTTASAIYNAPITLNATTTLKYFGKDTAGNSSAVQTQIYSILITGPYRLYFDGTTGYGIQLPSGFNKDTIEMDVTVYTNNKAGTANTGYLLDWRSASGGLGNGYVYNGGIGTGISGYYINGVAGTDKTTHWGLIPKDVKNTLKYVGTAAFTGNGALFMRNGSNDTDLRADIYGIRVYNGATLVAQYDLTNQANVSGTTITDISGNGHNATIVGSPTWLSN